MSCRAVNVHRSLLVWLPAPSVTHAPELVREQSGSEESEVVEETAQSVPGGAGAGGGAGGGADVDAQIVKPPLTTDESERHDMVLP